MQTETPTQGTTTEAPQRPRKRPTPETRRNCRRDYIQGKGSMRAIADRYGVNVSTVLSWSNEENWQDLRAQFDKRALETVAGQQTPEPPPAVPAPTQDTRLARIEKQLEQIEKAMDGAAPQAMRDLSAAHARLFDAYCTLAGIQKPGTRKSRRADRQSITPLEPRETPQPVGPATSGPMSADGVKP